MAKTRREPSQEWEVQPRGLRAVGGTAADAAAGSSSLGPLGAQVGAVVGGVTAMKVKKLPKVKPARWQPRRGACPV